MSAAPYRPETLDRAALDALSGATLVDFGTDWCPHCQAARPAVAATLAAWPALRHVAVEDGAGHLAARHAASRAANAGDASRRVPADHEQPGLAR